MEEQNQDQKIWHYYLVLDISKKNFNIIKINFFLLYKYICLKKK